MPVAAITAGSKISPVFPYPTAGMARVYIEASLPVDIFISTPQDAESITSLVAAAQLAPRVLIYNTRLFLNEIINVPPEWSTVGWSITIAHPGTHQTPIGVYYVVYPA